MGPGQSHMNREKMLLVEHRPAKMENEVKTYDVGAENYV
jgi:hypothetical protein